VKRFCCRTRTRGARLQLYVQFGLFIGSRTYDWRSKLASDKPQSTLKAQRSEEVEQWNRVTVLKEVVRCPAPLLLYCFFRHGFFLFDSSFCFEPLTHCAQPDRCFVRTGVDNRY
jgi:hypothetical protein